MKLHMLLQGFPYQASLPLDDNDNVKAISHDSRHIKPGALFISHLPSDQSNPKDHITDAIKRGARYILKNQVTTFTDDELAAFNYLYQNQDSKNSYNTRPLIFITVRNTRQARSHMAARLYPQQPTKIAAVTGTNGKTSTVTFLRQLWELCHYKAASIGSLGIQANVDLSDIEQVYNATPDAFTLHEILQKLTNEGVTHACMEASSHGIDQHRLENINLTAAAFTNLSHEHLDYHGTLNEYFEAKRRLFGDILPEGGIAVLNADDLHYKTLSETCKSRGQQIISYGRAATDIHLIDTTLTEHGQELKVKIFDEMHILPIPLLALVQGYNVMTAMGLAIGCGLNVKNIVAALPHLRSVSGRFERIGKHPSGGEVYVDYAHKAQALETVLTSLKPHISGQLSVVFGCGGDRDREKRAMMGEIAARHAHNVIVTDDNPRFENAATIRQEILRSCPDALEIPDRRRAIIHAVEHLKSHDICIIAGKGHETVQIIGNQAIPFNDGEIARAELRRLGGTVY